MPNKNDVTTAKLCAFARAEYSKRGVFDDNLAYDLIGEEYDVLNDFVAKIAEENTLNNYDFTKKYLAPIPIFRAAFTEEKLQKFAEKYGSVQYVICGAGYDTFSFRNKNENISVYEIDRIEIKEQKKKRIEELGWNVPKNVAFAAVDFENDNISDCLKNAGFVQHKKTFFSILGVSYYLSLPTFAKTISHISDIASPQSMLVFDYPDETIHTSFARNRIAELAVMTSKMGEKMNGGYYFDDMCEVMRSEQFRVETHLAADDIQERYFKNNSENFKAFSGVYIVSALKKDDTNYII